MDQRPPTLTPRQTEVLNLIALGDCHKQIAAKLGISIKSVEKFRGQIYRKAKINNTADAVHLALFLGIIQPKTWPL